MCDQAGRWRAPPNRVVLTREKPPAENGMKASAIEFRLRMWIQIVIVFLGFWAPWIGDAAIWAGDISTLAWLALEIGRLGIASFTVATPIVIVLGALAAAIGAVLRMWGAAYLGYELVHHGEMQGGGGDGRGTLPLCAQSALPGRMVHDACDFVC